MLARARACEQARDFKGARAEYDRCLASFPASAPVLVERGRVRLILDDSEGALADWSRAIELDPSSLRAWYYRGYALASQDAAASQEAFQRAAALEPRDDDERRYANLAREALGQASSGSERAARDPSPSAPGRPRRAIQGPFRRSAATWALIALNAGVMALHPELLSKPQPEDLLAAGALERLRVWGGEPWRMLTSMFVHIGAGHLVMNLYAMVVLCAVVEAHVGSWRFLAVYLLTGLAGSASSLLGHHVISAGASGAIFGIEGVFLALYRGRLGSWGRFFENGVVRRILWMTGIWIAIGLTVVPMDNYAHVGGLICGFLCGMFLMGSERWGRPLRVAGWAGLSALVFAFCVAAAVPWYVSGTAEGQRLASEGHKALKAGDYARAEELFSQALERGAEPVRARLGRASARDKLSKREAAAEDYREVVRLDPANEEAHWGLGVILAQEGRYAAAERSYTRALEIAPLQPELYYNRAAARRMLGDRQGAIRDARRAVELATDNPPLAADARRMLEDLLSDPAPEKP